MSFAWNGNRWGFKSSLSLSHTHVKQQCQKSFGNFVCESYHTTKLCCDWIATSSIICCYFCIFIMLSLHHFLYENDFPICSRHSNIFQRSRLLPFTSIQPNQKFKPNTSKRNAFSLHFSVYLFSDNFQSNIVYFPLIRDKSRPMFYSSLWKGWAQLLRTVETPYLLSDSTNKLPKCDEMLFKLHFNMQNKNGFDYSWNLPPPLTSSGPKIKQLKNCV